MVPLIFAAGVVPETASRAAFLVFAATALVALATLVARWSARAWARGITPRPEVQTNGTLGASTRDYLFRLFASGALLAAVALVAFALVAGVTHVAGHTVTLDKTLASGLHTWAGPRGVRFMMAVSFVGAPAGMAVLTAASALALYRRDRVLAWVWGISFVGGQVLDGTLKELYRRARPVLPDPFVKIATYSFPSGHSVGVMVGMGMLAYTIVRLVAHATLRLAGVVLCVLGALLVGFSRMYLGAHFYTDVLGGFLTGGVWLAVCISAVEALRVRPARR